MTHPGPSHPGPSGPSQPSAPSRGHLPIGAGAPRPPVRCLDCGGEVEWIADVALHARTSPDHDPVLPQQPLPRLGELIRDAERLGAQLLAVLRREYDPASAPADLAWPGSSGITVVGLHLAFAAADVQSALASVGRAAAEADMPAVGSAVPVIYPDPAGGLICVGKSLADGVPAACGDPGVHGQHRVYEVHAGGDSRARSGGSGTSGGPS